MNVTIQTTEVTAFENSLFFKCRSSLCTVHANLTEAIIEFPADPGYCKADSPPGSGFRG